MPCSTTDHLTTGDMQWYITQLPKVEALLCGVFTSFSPEALSNMLKNLDYERIGVSQEWAETWWERHQRAHEANTRKC